MESSATPEQPSGFDQAAGRRDGSDIEVFPRQPPSLIDASLRGLLMRGHRAASFELEEVAGKWRFSFFVDDEVECRVRYSNEAGERIVLFADVWRLAAGGFTIVDIAPTTRPLLWQAMACDLHLDADGDLTGAPTLHVTAARDNVRGLAGLVYSREWEVPGHGNLGDRLTRALQSTRIDGPAARVRRVRERLTDDEARAATAAATSMHLQAEGAWKDGGLPPAELSIVEVDLSSGAHRSLASIGDWNEGALTDSKRRSRLFGAVLHELEVEAFGSRGNAERIFEPLDDLSSNADGDFRDDAETRLDLADLVARAGLSTREMDALKLLQSDMTQEEIANRLGVELGTIKATLSHARAKLRAEAVKNFTEYRQSA